MSTGQGHLAVEREAKAPHNQALPPSSSVQGRSLIAPSPSGLGERVDKQETAPSSDLDKFTEAFLSRQYNQLPTPQSPNNFTQYALGASYTPESPIPYNAQSSYEPFSYPLLEKLPTVHRPVMEEARISAQPTSKQTMTPESSPYAPRTHTTRYNNETTSQANLGHYSIETSAPRTNNSSYDITLPSPAAAPTPSASAKLESPASTMVLAPAHRISPPSASTSEQANRSSRLSSPFMAKLSLTEQTAQSRNPTRPESYSPQPHPVQIDDVFSTPSLRASSGSVGGQNILSSSLPPASSLPQMAGMTRGVPAGGEMERIRRAMMQNQLAHFQQVEDRRPEYLKRTKRTLSEADPTALTEDETAREQERTAVGIMESPNKGRRLKLFQETSEESFEESLMAGGYGRYRTADWVRQPQPLMPTTPGPAGPSSIITVLEEAEEAPLSDKEMKKRNRLAAFRGHYSFHDEPTSKPFPVELEGRGRVLLDVAPEDQIVRATLEATPAKKKVSNRRKRKGVEPTAKEKRALATVVAAAEEDPVDRPNWPDTEFPWRLRTEERAKLIRSIEEEKMKWIERFLDRDSGDEDEEDAVEAVEGQQEDIDVSPPAKWGLAYGNEVNQRLLTKMGRGKMIPLLANPSGARTHVRRRKAFFPSDPADARAALMSKKSVRALSYRHQMRQRQAEDDSDEEGVCLCHGVNDGRELVQCDGCETWYHLQCIGIKNIADLGREEDLWFCQRCEAKSRLPLSDLEDRVIMFSEPTFAPTDDELQVRHSSDTPFFQPSLLQDSPMAWNPQRMPKTPTKSGRNSDYDPGLSSASGSSWIESSRHGPSTPKQQSLGVKVYTNTSGGFDGYAQSCDESPFDPTSTPSRGIKFGAPFTTPKNNVWSMRANGLFHTPSKPSGRSSPSKIFGGPGTLSSMLDDSGGGNGVDIGFSPFGKVSAFDESPIRHTKTGEGLRMRRIMDSPLASRSMGSFPPYMLEESPVMRSKGKERLFQYERGSFDDAP